MSQSRNIDLESLILELSALAKVLCGAELWPACDNLVYIVNLYTLLQYYIHVY